MPFNQQSQFTGRSQFGPRGPSQLLSQFGQAPPAAPQMTAEQIEKLRRQREFELRRQYQLQLLGQQFRGLQ